MLMLIATNSAWSIGTTADDPYLISSAEELKTFATGINSGIDFNYWKDDAITIPANGLNQYFKLDANIDLSSVCDSTEESEVS